MLIMMLERATHLFEIYSFFPIYFNWFFFSIIALIIYVMISYLLVKI